MSFKYYLFDLDNCILHFINSEKYFDNIFADTLKDFVGFIPKREERRKAWYSPDLNRFIQRKWSINKQNEFWQCFKTLDIRKRKEFIEKGNIFFDPSALNVISILRKKNKKIALVTNSPKYIVRLLDQNFNFYNLFDEVLSIDYDEAPFIAKPSPKGIELVLKKFCSSKVENCKLEAIMIGNSEIDITAAKKAGIFSCLMINKNNKKLEFRKWKDKPDFIIHTFYELFDL